MTPHVSREPSASRQISVTDIPHDMRTRNRRKRYLDLHPEYFEQPSLELAGVLLPFSTRLNKPNAHQIHYFMTA